MLSEFQSKAIAHDDIVRIGFDQIFWQQNGKSISAFHTHSEQGVEIECDSNNIGRLGLSCELRGICSVFTAQCSMFSVQWDMLQDMFNVHVQIRALIGHNRIGGQCCTSQ